MQCCEVKGASSWLSALPLDQYGFSLNKGEFVDVLCLRYGLALPNLPSHCVCSKDFSVSQAFSCPHGAFPILHHNGVRDSTAKLLYKVCHDVQVEPHLQPLSGEVLRHWLRMILGWISEPLAFGDVHIIRPSSMCEFSTVLRSLALAATFRWH